MKILVVDDSFLLRNRLLKIIRSIKEQFALEEASSVSEALFLLTSFRPDVIILDIELPDESGITVLQKIKSIQPAVKVIILTNYPNDEFRRNCIRLGADYFLDKSKTFRNIPTILNELLHNQNIQNV